MTTTLVFLALLMAAFVVWLVRQSINVRPWVAEASAAEGTPFLPDAATAPRIALGIFLAVVTSLFALCISAYLMRMEMAADWQPVPTPGLLWVNTAMLVLASVFLQWSWHRVKQGDIKALYLTLVAGGICTALFIGGQYLVWRELLDAGYYLGTNPANAFFYMLTALHALHLLGGLVPWSGILMKLRRGAPSREVRASIELCAVYWHFLLLIWVVLFGLVLST